MTETILKIALIPVSMLAYVVIARVVHLRPELITNLFNQSGNAQGMTLQQRAIACDPKSERLVPTMSKNELNNFVFDCEERAKKK